MSMGAALKAANSAGIARQVVAIELLCAAQGLDYLAPLTPSAALQRVQQVLRAHVPTLTDDRPPSPDIARLARLIAEAELERAASLA